MKRTDQLAREVQDAVDRYDSADLSMGVYWSTYTGLNITVTGSSLPMGVREVWEHSDVHVEHIRPTRDGRVEASFRIAGQD